MEGTKKESALKQIDLILSQMHFMQGYVNDLLDLQQIKDGVFTLSPALFNPTKTFNMVCSLFAP